MNTFYVNKDGGAVSNVNAFGVMLALLNPYCYKLFRHVSSYQDQAGFCFFSDFLTRFLTSMRRRALCPLAPHSSAGIPAKTAT